MGRGGRVVLSQVHVSQYSFNTCCQKALQRSFIGWTHLSYELSNWVPSTRVPLQMITHVAFQYSADA